MELSIKEACNAIRDSSNHLQKISSKIPSVDLRLLWSLICGVYNLLLCESRLLLVGQSEMMKASTSGLATNVLMIEIVAWDGEASWYFLPRGCCINLVIYKKFDQCIFNLNKRSENWPLFNFEAILCLNCNCYRLHLFLFFVCLPNNIHPFTIRVPILNFFSGIAESLEIHFTRCNFRTKTFHQR